MGKQLIEPPKEVEKTETIQFLGIMRSCYVGKFSMSHPGQTREVPASEALRLCKTFPMDFRVLPKPRVTEKSAGVPAPEQLKPESKVMRTVRYKGQNPTKLHGKPITEGEVVRIDQRLASILVHTGLYEILEGEKPATGPSDST